MLKRTTLFPKLSTSSRGLARRQTREQSAQRQPRRRSAWSASSTDVRLRPLRKTVACWTWGVSTRYSESSTSRQRRTFTSEWRCLHSQRKPMLRTSANSLEGRDLPQHLREYGHSEWKGVHKIEIRARESADQTCEQRQESQSCKKLRISESFENPSRS